MCASRPNSAIAAIARLPQGTGTVHFRNRDAWSELVIDHPTRAGAVSPGMMQDFVAAADRLGAAPCAILVIRGTSDRAFCAGGDLGAVRDHLMVPEGAAAMLDAMTWALDTIQASAELIIGAVEGVALGGGAELLTVCDHLILGENARIGFVHARLGVSPGWGGARRLRERVGRRSARMWLLDTRPRSATEAVAQGLADRVVAAGTAQAEAEALAENIAELPDAARNAVQQLVDDGDSVERALFLRLWGSTDHQLALSRVAAGR